MFKVIKNHQHGTKGLFKATEKGIVRSTFKQDIVISVGVRLTWIWVLALALASYVILGTLGSLCKNCIMRTWPYTFWTDTIHTRGPTRTRVHAHKHTRLWSILPDHFLSKSAHCPCRNFPTYLSSRPFRPPRHGSPPPKKATPSSKPASPYCISTMSGLELSPLSMLHTYAQWTQIFVLWGSGGNLVTKKFIHAIWGQNQIAEEIRHILPHF